MLIRIGYDIRFDIDVPAPLVAMLSVHPSRRQDLQAPGVAAGAGGLRPGCTRRWSSAIPMRVRRARRSMSTPSGSACAASSSSWRSRCAGASTSRALCHRLPGRHRRAGRRADGFQRLVRGVSGGRWWTCDAPHNARRIGRVLIATGCDAIDVAMTTSFGATRLSHFTVITDEVGPA